MKSIFFCALLLLSPGCPAAEPSAPTKPLTAVIQEQAKACADALPAGKYETVVNYTHRRIVEKMGGKEAMIAVLTRGTKQMADEKTAILKADIGTPTKPRENEGWLISLVPQKITIKVDGGTLLASSHLIAVSEDKGVSWVFMDTTKAKDPRFMELFPELKGMVEIPETTKPKFTPDP